MNYAAEIGFEITKHYRYFLPAAGSFRPTGTANQNQDDSFQPMRSSSLTTNQASQLWN